MTTQLIASLAKYHLLGQTGLRVSPLALGTSRSRFIVSLSGGMLRLEPKARLRVREGSGFLEAV